MSNTDLNHDVEHLLNAVREHLPPDETLVHLFAELLATLSQTLLSPIAAIMGMAQALQQQTFSPEQQKDYLGHIYQTSKETLTLINRLLEHAHTAPGNIKEPYSSYNDTLNNSYDELKGIHTLIIDDNKTRREILRQQLNSLKLKCDVVDTESALRALYSEKKNPYQIAVVSAHHFDHHVAYLVRTIRANASLSTVMPVLAISSDIPDFEKESAYFSGFACIINSLKPTRLPSKLLNSWLGWAAKINFTPIQTARTKNRILVVEDDPIPQKVMQRQLSELGYSIHTANTGQNALKYLEQESYDLVFMDIGLPDISGLEVTAEFRKRENSGHRTPIIGLTMHALGSDQEMGLQAGMDEYLVKPLLQDKLKAVLQQWIKK